MGGFGRAVRFKLDTYQIDEVVAAALSLLGSGVKVVCEISAMVADAELVRTDQEVIAIAGSYDGADAAVVVQPANVHHFFDMKVQEIICKSRL